MPSTACNETPPADAEDEPPPDAAKARRRLPAPKLALPGNAESYNPPSEYLFTDEERQTWGRWHRHKCSLADSGFSS